MKRIYALAIPIVAGSLLFAAACGGGDDNQSTSSTTTGPAATQAAQAAATAVKPAEPANRADLARLRGDIIADGSSTVYPITQAAAEEFRQYARDVRVSVGISGTGGGFKKFCNNETDISNASRPIRPTESQECAARNIEYIELPVAYDGLAVVVHPRNSWASCLTKAELKKIWEPEAQGRITNWNQVRASFPDKPLKLYGPGTDSGTFDYFTEAITGKEKASRGDFQASEDDNVLVTGVSGDEGALGYFGYAYAVENRDKVKIVAIDNGDGNCVELTAESVRDGTYQPLSRPLFMYVSAPAAQRPQVRGFINFYLSKSFTPLIQTREVGYIPLEEELYEAAAARFNQGITGTLFLKGAEVGATLDRYLAPASGR